MIISEKIKQFSVTILIVLSLFASSVAACCCDHHEEKPQAETASCHSRTDETTAEKHQKPQAEKDEQSKQINAPCECLFESAPRIVAKSENVKAEKQFPLFTTQVASIRGFIAVRAPSPTRFEFAKFGVTDSAYNLKSPRAPPRL